MSVRFLGSAASLRLAMQAAIGLSFIFAAGAARAQVAVDTQQGRVFDQGVRGQNPYRLLSKNAGDALWEITENTSSRGVAGGLDADSYDWRDIDSGAPWGVRGHKYTTLEFLRESRDANSWPQFTANVVGGGTVVPGGPWGDYYVYDTSTPVNIPAEMAADWVRYTNRILQNYRQGDTITDAEDQRVLNSISNWAGRDTLLAPGEGQTPRVEYWEVGNEPEVSVGGVFEQHTMSAATYRDRYLAVSQAMLAEDPTIKVGPCIVYPGGSSHYLEALRDAGAQIDFLGYHPYYSNLQGAWGNGNNLASALRGFKSYLNNHAQDARNILGEDIELLATEWNPMMWNASGTQQRSMAMALGVVEGVFTFAEDGVKAAHFWEQAQGKPAVKAMYQKLETHMGEEIVFTHADHNIRIYVTRETGSDDLIIWAMNFSDDTEETVTLSLENWPFAIGEMTMQRYGKTSGDTALMDSTDLGWTSQILAAGEQDPRSLELTLQDATVSVYSITAAIPEPASLALLVTAGALLLRPGRGRSKAVASMN